MPELFMGLVAFAFFGTLFTVLIGKKLVKLNFEMLQREADFRFSLVRVRENAESIGKRNEINVKSPETISTSMKCSFLLWRRCRRERNRPSVNQGN